MCLSILSNQGSKMIWTGNMQVPLSMDLPLLLSVLLIAGLTRTLFMENRNLYGPSIDICPGKGRQPVSSLISALKGSGEFQVLLRSQSAFGLRLVPAAHPRRRVMKSLEGTTAYVAGGTKVRL